MEYLLTEKQLNKIGIFPVLLGDIYLEMPEDPEKQTPRLITYYGCDKVELTELTLAEAFSL